MTADAAGDRSAQDLAVLGGRPLSPQDPAMVGRYRIHALLGIGGMGRVYLAWAQNPGFGSRAGAWVAVKVIRPDLADNPEFRRRFARELETAGRVRSPYAAALVQGEPEAAQPWMVTEFVPGVALADAVQPGWPLPAASVWRLAHDLGNALVAVHQAGIVHRDVKPSNVILGNGGAKIIDFGVAHASDLSQLTATGMNIGTPSYMAPEQAKSGDVSPASDVFSLGVLLYFAASGRLPFGEGGTAEVLFRVVYEDPDVSALNDVEPGLRDLILRCMGKDPLHRPNAAGVVAMAQSAASAGVWSPNERVQWPEALAAQIHERTLAAGRTLPDPSLAGDREPTRPEAAAPPPSAYDAPDSPVLLPPVDSTPTMFSGSGFRSAEQQAPKKKRGVLVGSLSAAAVLALAVTAILVWGPGSGASANQAGGGGASASSSGSSVAGSGLGNAGGGGSGAASASSSASASTSAGPSASSSSSSSAGSSPSAGSSSSAATQPTSAKSSSAVATASTSTSAAGVPNQYTASEACGSGFSQIDSHGITGATIYLMYNSSTGYNCVVTLAKLVSGKVSMNATLAVQGGSSGSNPGSFTYYAGPVKEHAPSQCVMWGGSYKSSSWTSGWSHCG